MYIYIIIMNNYIYILYTMIIYAKSGGITTWIRLNIPVYIESHHGTCVHRNWRFPDWDKCQKLPNPHIFWASRIEVFCFKIQVSCKKSLEPIRFSMKLPENPSGSTGGVRSKFFFGMIPYENEPLPFPPRRQKTTKN